MGAGETKLRFQKAVLDLQEKSVDRKDPIWPLFWTLPTSSDEVFGLIKTEDVREIKKKHPENLKLLLYRTVKQMRNILGAEKRTTTEYTVLMNCVRIVTRVLPFIFEDISQEAAQQLFWSNTPLGPKPVVPPEAEIKVAGAETTVDSDDETSANLATTLIDSLLALLFLPNLTISPPKQPPSSKSGTLPLEYIWASGIGVKEVLPTAKHMIANRTEILKCLLVCLSEMLYQPPDTLRTYHNRWLDYITTQTNLHSLPLFYSLINTVATYDPIGWGIPYNHYLFADPFEELMNASIQLLCVLLNHHPSEIDLSRPGEVDTPASTLLPHNIYTEFLKDIQRPEDFKLLFATMDRLLNNPLVANNTYLPNSTKQVGCHQEVLMLLWLVLRESPSFLNHMLRLENPLRLVYSILHYLHEGRKDTAQLGLVHLGTFILLLLSGEREFGVALNQPLAQRPAIDLPVFSGNYADLMILVFVKLLLDGHERLDSLYECLLTIIANISPYVKSLAMVTAVRMLKLFDALSKPKFLFAAEHHHRYLFFLLEAFNNIIQYQYEGNARLVYALIRNRDVVTRLAQLQVPSATRRTDGEPASTAESEVAQSGPSLPAEQPPASAATVSSPEAAATPSQPTLAPNTHTPETTASEVTIDGSSAAQSTTTTTTAVAAAATSAPPPHPPSETAIEPATTAAATAPPAQDAAAEVPAPPQPAGSPKSSAAFVVTPEWLQAWKQRLPLGTLMKLLGAIVPQLPQLCTGSSSDETAILDYLHKTTMVGLLPLPHPILIRRYQQNEATNLWFTKHMWGVLYLRNQNPPLFFATTVRLFHVNLAAK